MAAELEQRLSVVILFSIQVLFLLPSVAILFSFQVIELRLFVRILFALLALKIDCFVHDQEESHHLNAASIPPHQISNNYSFRHHLSGAFESLVFLIHFR